MVTNVQPQSVQNEHKSLGILSGLTQTAVQTTSVALPGVVAGAGAGLALSVVPPSKRLVGNQIADLFIKSVSNEPASETLKKIVNSAENASILNNAKSFRTCTEALNKAQNTNYILTELGKLGNMSEKSLLYKFKAKSLLSKLGLYEKGIGLDKTSLIELLKSNILPENAEMITGEALNSLGDAVNKSGKTFSESVMTYIKGAKKGDALFDMAINAAKKEKRNVLVKKGIALGIFAALLTNLILKFIPKKKKAQEKVAQGVNPLNTTNV